ncbi:MAG: ParB/RepB/Spo0J family partition protein [Chloroflexota bacterium]
MPDVELKQIQPNRMNPRTTFSKAGLDDLSASIRQYGILEPIIVRPVNSHYEVVVGERRYRAAQQAGLDEVPVIVRTYSDEEVMEINLVENVQREDLSAVEKGRLCQKLREQFPDHYPNWDGIARRIGVEPDTVRAWVRTLELPEEIQDRIAPRESQRVPKGKIAYRTALEVAQKIQDPDRQVEVIQRLADEPMSGAIAQEIIRRAATEPPADVSLLVQEAAEEARPTLTFNHRNYKAIVASEKTQTTRRRLDPSLKPGTMVRAAVSYFADLQITDVVRKRLGELTAEDAQREGGYTLQQFKDMWERQIGPWDPNEQVYLVQFEVDRVR